MKVEVPVRVVLYVDVIEMKTDAKAFIQGNLVGKISFGKEQFCLKNFHITTLQPVVAHIDHITAIVLYS